MEIIPSTLDPFPKKIKKNMTAMFEAVDVFPVGFSESVTRLKYPENNFKFWENDPDIKVFVTFANNVNKIYYLKKTLSEKAVKTISQIGKSCKTGFKIDSTQICSSSIAKRLKINPFDLSKKNSDTRMGFKLRNAFLVKPFFTFGLRNVERGSAHLIQTLNAPLVLYLFPNNDPRCEYCERILPFRDFGRYGLSILKPDGAYRIPPGVRYFLLSMQKNYFSFDVVPESAEIPFEYSDPVKNRISRMTDPYERPVKTPYIEEASDSDWGDETPRQENQSFSQLENYTFLEQENHCSMPQDIIGEFFQTRPFQQQQPSNHLAVEEEPQQTVTYLLISNPVLEKTVVPVSVEFAKAYQSLKPKELAHPEKENVPKNNEGEDPFVFPLDLRIRIETVDLVEEGRNDYENKFEALINQQQQQKTHIENNAIDQTATCTGSLDMDEINNLLETPVNEKQMENMMAELIAPEAI